MHDMLESPESWVANIQRYTASIASTVIYGWRTPNVNTGYVKDLIEVSQRKLWCSLVSVPNGGSGWIEHQLLSTYSLSTFSLFYVHGTESCRFG